MVLLCLSFMNGCGSRRSCDVYFPIYYVDELHPEFEKIINDSIIPKVMALDCEMADAAVLCLLENDYVLLRVYDHKDDISLDNDMWNFYVLQSEPDISIFIVKSAYEETYAINRAERCVEPDRFALPSFCIGGDTDRGLIYTDTIFFHDDTMFFIAPTLE